MACGPLECLRFSTAYATLSLIERTDDENINETKDFRLGSECVLEERMASSLLVTCALVSLAVRESFVSAASKRHMP